MSEPTAETAAPAAFAPQAGHLEIQQNILISHLGGRMPHAYLFYGPEGCGKEALAIALAQLLNAGKPDGQIDDQSATAMKIAHLQHPDLKFIMPTPAQSNIKDGELTDALKEKALNPYRKVTFSGKNLFIGIDTIRELKKEAGFKLYEGRKKVFIISEADQMRVEAANALLKLLEEPPDNLMLILITSNIYKMLPTIKSRCQMLRFGFLPEPLAVEIVRRHAPKESAGADIALLIRLSGFNLKRTFDFLDSNVLEIRDIAIEFLRKIVMIHKSHDLLKLIEPIAAKKDREDTQLLLWFLLLWFQDLLHLNEQNLPAEQLYNFDKKDTLDKFRAFTPNADIIGIVRELEDGLQALGDVRNFNPLLILGDLAIKLQKLIRRN